MTPETPAQDRAAGRAGGDFYEFGPFQLDPSRRVLLREGVYMALTPKAFETLLVLVQDAGRVVPKEELLERVWPDAVVEEGSITNNISALRKILNSDFSGEGPIATVARRGYRFTADVRLRGAEAGVAVRAPAPSRTGLSARWRTAIPLVVAAAATTATAVFLASRPRTFPFEHVRQELLITNSRSLGSTGVSPDGRFIAIIDHENANDGLYLFNVATKSTLPLLPPTPLRLGDVRFSHDGNSVYFRRSAEVNAETDSLFRIPVLGGSTVRIADNANSEVTFSPDQRRLAFIRWNPKGGHATIMVANTDGTGERALATMPYRTDYLAWSPDGNLIAVSAPEGLDVVDTATGEATPLYRGTSSVRNPVWLPDGKGVLVRFDDPDIHHRQIAFISDQGEFRRITSDTSHYNSALTLTADGRTIVTTIDRFVHVINIAALHGAGTSGQETEIASGSVIDGVAWTKNGLLSSLDGRLVRTSPNAQSEILIDETAFRAKRPAACGDDAIVYRSEAEGRLPSIWRSDANGTHRQLLTDKEASFPVCSPDGRWAIYADNKSNHLHKIAVTGGTPTDLAISPVHQVAFAFSPDFKRLVYEDIVPPQTPVWRMVNSDTREVIRDFPLVDSRRVVVQFMRDGTAFVYLARKDGIDNLYLQPVDGSAGRFLTASTDPARILDFSFSPDGRSVALVRARLLSDLVMIRDDGEQGSRSRAVR